MDDPDFPEGMYPPDEREMLLKCKAMALPYIERMQAEPWNMEALNAEMQWRAGAIVFEFELRKYLPDCDHSVFQTKTGASGLS